MKYSVFLFYLWILSGILLSACSDGPKSKNQESNRYIYGHTSGTITSDSPVEIYLEKPVGEKYRPGEVLPPDILKITPDTEGRLTLKDEQTLEFVPTGRYKNGQEYTFRLRVGALLDVSQEYQYFTFRVGVTELKAAFSPGALSTAGNNDTLSYEASLLTSDFMPDQEAELEVAAALDGKPLSIEWQHNGNIHRFKIPKIAKTDEPQELKLTFGERVSGKPENRILIPGKSQFTVMNIELNDNSRNSVKVTFSGNLDPAQNIEGLITIEGEKDVRYAVNGNAVYLYYTPGQDQEETEVTVHRGIRSNDGQTLLSPVTRTLQLPLTNPAVRFIGEGVITPAEGKVLVPFSAVALKAVDVQIIKVFRQNMNFFFQENSYDGSYELKRTARPVFRKKISLIPENGEIHLNRWNDFTLDLSELVQLEKGVIYRLEIRFRRSYTTLPCAETGGEEPEYYNNNWDGEESYYSMYYYNPDFRWSERDDPCSNSYYNSDRFIGKNIVNTSLGLTAKRGADNRYFVAVNDIATARPVAGCRVSLYDYQNQRLDSAETDKNGFVYLDTDTKAYIVQAAKDGDRAWLRIADANSLPMSNFDVSGVQVESGLKGFIYGERGVWRPGDEIYLSFILEDKLGILPEGHPVVAQLTDPQGNITETRKSTIGESPIHTFRFSTAEDAPTGYWKATVKIGGSRFTKTLRIETVKPNRLSIDMRFPDEKVIGKGVRKQEVTVKTRWLNGARTSNLKAITEVRLRNTHQGFADYPDYSFSDIAEDFQPYEETLFDGKTDAEGDYSFNLGKIRTENAPGMLNATFTTRVFENGGDFSIATYNTRYSPYTSYAGIRLPQSDDGWYPTHSDIRLQGLVVGPTGEKNKTARKIRIRVYKINWSWWWEDNAKGGAYIYRSSNALKQEQEVTARNGEFSAGLNIGEYGRYYVQATDLQSGHTAGTIAYFGSWAENASAQTATLLSLNSEQKTYKTGEKVRIEIPSSAGSTAIVSLENGTGFRDIRRLETQHERTYFEFEAKPEMCPNVYVFVSLIQPQQKRDNDHPVRLYGVVNINVEDAALHLHPEIGMPSGLRPGEEFQVTVGEKDHQGMTYTLAIVDEGLLSLTSFRTPEPFPAFYAREALGVKTWDFYDYIFGAYGARLEKAFAVGGDEALKAVQDEKTNRFKPVVLFEGPVTLKRGESHTHTFRMPDYIGEVRAMVVAATTNGKYGSASASAPVNKPLMLSAALPRLFTPGDVVEIPVTVFAMNDQVRNVKVSLATGDKVVPEGPASTDISFREKGEQVVWFKLRVKENTGIASLTFSARSGNETAQVTENTEIRLPNPRITRIEARNLKSGESAGFSADLQGADPTALLEISTIPPLNLGERLEYLITYPHGCAEQITSAAFPQLFLGDLTSLGKAQESETEKNVKSVIQRLSAYQTADGGFAYWPGSRYTSEWVSTYIADFLLQAGRKGYQVPPEMLQKDLNFLQSLANGYRNLTYEDELQQGYRLYVLALAGKPAVAAMNRLKEQQPQNPTARWLLASAYALTAHPDVALNLIRNTPRTVDPYFQTGGTFGSAPRDKAIMLQSMVYLDLQKDAREMLEQLSAVLSSPDWMSTQATAFALLAVSEYVQKFVGNTDGLACRITGDGISETIRTNKTVYQQPLPAHHPALDIDVKNTGSNAFYARLISSVIPYRTVRERIMSGLSLQVVYTDDKGQKTDIDKIAQGTDITAAITVTNTGITGTYDNLALSYLLPSGCEIINDRLTGNTQAFRGADYADIRDDRYYVYFSLEQGKSKTFRFRFNAAFPGSYDRPAIQCSAMYNNNIQAVLPGGRTVIEK